MQRSQSCRPRGGGDALLPAHPRFTGAAQPALVLAHVHSAGVLHRGRAVKIKDSVVLAAVERACAAGEGSWVTARQVARQLPEAGPVVIGRKLGRLAQDGQLVRVRIDRKDRYRVAHTTKEN